MRLPAGRGDCIKGKDTEGNIYRRLAGGRSGSIFPNRAYGRAAWQGGPILAAVAATSANFASCCE